MKLTEMDFSWRFGVQYQEDGQLALLKTITLHGLELSSFLCVHIYAFLYVYGYICVYSVCMCVCDVGASAHLAFVTQECYSLCFRQGCH